ncbi:spore coat protein CotJB [Acetanaerobacterium sp. MSJ-12]|uniref:Spore coat protein CotJB n=1 Tax=Bittarella massiliensis (ex Durand et al. 2017) TaxID=1720313 RepID=A0AAP1LG04_9FIRM|nr:MULTISPECIES: spore coat protein CotJB [Eubacteriales]MCB5940742.1 spore coat protein CotJB [bacterium 210820-DFI.6.52]ERI98911.1 hypothetical protein HMPREF0262_02375 [Clostridium sp. ATCC 29733]MBC2870810.1 spore coat protein CotJB [Bittarella massiliensis (ex Durand et al. 2017)]MBU5419242.1 spore coat protein CotJB [Acetanaerobacterium sp. MSJ-12]MCQ4948751.1 spore coat protein CotJB [Bittarella massiliensis (ex Durand et al. 2017)]
MNREKEKLMKVIRESDFAIQECALYLDTHPRDSAALRLYGDQQALRKKAVDAYEQAFGPLTTAGNQFSSWRWIDDPWPWDLED